MTEVVDFRTRLQAATTAARAHLSSGGPGSEGYNPTDRRAAAYHEIATVLLDEGLRTGNAHYQAAARMLQEQAEITTYSGPNGVAAIIGNMNAMMLSANYDIPLDFFSWKIDDAVVKFFQNVAEKGDLWEITRNNVLAVDGLVWDSFGLLNYFPGNAIGYNFDAPRDTTLWSLAAPGQLERLHGRNMWGDNLKGVTEIAFAIQLASFLEKKPEYYGFTEVELKNLANGGTLARRLTNNVGWTATKDHHGVIRIRNDAGLDGYYSNGIEMVTPVQKLLQTITATFGLVPDGRRGILQDFGTWDVQGDNIIFTPFANAADLVKDVMGADLGPGGLRIRYGQGAPGDVHTDRDLFEFWAKNSREPGKSIIPDVQLFQDESDPTAIQIYGRRNVNGQEQVVYVELRQEADGTFSEKKVVADVDADGNIGGLNLSDKNETTLLNLQSLQASEKQLAALIKASSPKLPIVLDGLLDWGPELTGGSPLQQALLTSTIDAQGNLILKGFKTRLISYDPRTKTYQHAITTEVDEYGREISLDLEYKTEGNTKTFTGVKRIRDGEVEIYSKPGEPTTIRLLNSPVGLDFVNAAETITSVLGRHFIGGNVLVQTVTSAGLKTLASNFGDILNTAVFDSGVATTKNMGEALKGMDVEFLNNLKSAGISALGAYLTAELVDLTGLEGLPAEVLNSLGGTVVNQIITNIAEMALGNTQITSVFQGVGNLAQLGNVAASFVGNKLASEIANWDEIGEQLGSSIGGSLGGLAGPALLAQIGIPIPIVGAVIGAFLGNLMGGMIGGVFTGKPKSGAIVGFNEATGQFEVEQVWKEDGGKKRAAQELGKMAAGTLNQIIGIIDGDLVNGEAVDAGSYGLRGVRYTFWEDGVKSDNRVKFKEAEDLIEHGVMAAVGQFQILGGDVYAKRALAATLATAGLVQTQAETGGIEAYVGQLYDEMAITTVDYSLDTLLGNFALVGRVHEYLQSPGIINSLISAEPHSGFTADWMLAFARIEELGLLRRSAHDWDGGFSYLLGKAETDARDVDFSFEAIGEAGNGERAMFLGARYMSDTVDSASKTVIEGAEDGDRLTGAPAGPGHIANVIHGGAGDDELIAAASGDDLFGGGGADLLVGGVLDDWLVGGDGNDVLDAGGGNGNLLVGGTGDDFLTGADGPAALGDGGSDWLIGGAGKDRLLGRRGNDYIEGARGNDVIDGGIGSDTVIYHAMDGVDQVSDSGTAASDRDVLAFGREIAAAQATVVARSSGETLSIFMGLVAGGGRIDLRGVAFGESAGIDEFQFGDVSWSRGDLTAAAIFSKMAGATVIGTSAGEDLFGTIHDDSLSGAAGNDSLAGGMGSDLYHFGLGDGVDSIVETGFASDLDTLLFGAGISAANIAVAFSPAQPSDLVVTVGAFGDQLILKNQLSPTGANSIEQILFADGTSWTLRDLIARVPATPATTGADVLVGTHATDVIAGGTGNDVITGSTGDDNLDGGGGADTYHYKAGDGHDRIHDSRHRDLSANILSFGTGIDPLKVRVGRDQADSANLILTFGEAGGSVLLDNQLHVSTFAGDLFDHGLTKLTFDGGTEWTRSGLIATMLEQASSARADHIEGSRFGDTVSAGAGVDLVSTGDAADTITGGLGNDSLDGGYGSDTYHYALGDGDDRIHDSRYRDSGSTNSLVFGQGVVATDLRFERDLADLNNLIVTFAEEEGTLILDDQLITSTFAFELYDHGIDTFVFADSTSMSRTAVIAELLLQSSTASADVIRGSRRGDTIVAGAGADIVEGADGADTITGGLGDDSLDGGYGSDTFVYAAGDGDDRIHDSRYRDGGSTNILALGTGLDPIDLILERDPADSNNLRITFADETGSILLDDQFHTSYYAGDPYDHGIDKITFTGGTEWSRTALIGHLFAQGSTANRDQLLGSRLGDTLSTGAGDDILWGGDGNDSLTGGTGDDNLDGGSGSDTYVYGAGHDRIYDSTYREPTTVNTLVLGPGVAIGNLVLERDHADSNNVRIWFNNGTGSVLLDDQFSTSSYAGTQYKHGIASILFDDGTSWNRTQIEAAVVSAKTSVNGTTGIDVLNGTSGRDDLFGSGGNDTLRGGAGSDLLRGGAGNDLYEYNVGDGFDVIVEESGTDTIRFGPGISSTGLALSRPSQDGDTTGVVISLGGNDRLYVKAAAGIERYEFEDGSFWTEADLREELYAQLKTAGADSIYGSALEDSIEGGDGADKIYGYGGNDLLDGNAGSDLVEGGGGNDVYLFGRGSGRDVVVEESGTDTIRFGADIDWTQLVVTRPLADWDSGGMVIGIAGTADEIYIKGATGIESYEFAGGLVWTEAQMRELLFTQSKTAGSDVIVGSGLVDSIAGGAGGDEIYGGAGADTLEGNAGNDLVQGGDGNDLFLFNAGDGRDVIQDDSGTDTIKFGPGLSIDQIRVTRPAADWDSTGIVITFEDTGDQVYVKNAVAIEKYEFADGSVLTEAAMRELLFVQGRSEGDDLIQGSSLADSFTGGGGDDRLYGSGGADTIGGGRGEDLLEGGSGNDVYVYNRGDGRDVVSDESGTDAVRFGSGIIADDLIVNRPAQDGDSTGLVFTLRGTGDTLYVKNAAAVERYEFSDGTFWTYANATALLAGTSVSGSTIAVTMGADVILGSDQADTFQARGGDDVIRGGAGSDTYRFSRGDGYDIIHDPVSDGDTDTLILTDIASTAVRVIAAPTDPDDIVIFVDDSNQIYLDQQKVGTSGGIDQVQFSDSVTWTRADLLAKASAGGGAGADSLIGTSFGDTLQGGADGDTLEGRAGGDTYVYNNGDGADSIVELGSAGALPVGLVPGAADDRILFGSGIVAADIVVAHGSGGGDVIVTFANSAGSIRLAGQNEGSGAGIEFLVFHDGSTLAVPTLLAASLELAVTGGNDLIRGFFTPDDLRGGLGDDVLEGAAGSDRYLFGIGDGKDELRDLGGGGLDLDEIVLGAGIAVADVSLRRRAADPNDLTLVIGTNGDEIRLIDQLEGRGEGVELVRFHDGTTWSREQILDLYSIQPATEDGDFLAGAGESDTFDGLGGNDVIEGRRGDDTLSGGNGNDDIRGGEGADVLAGNSGDDILSGGPSLDQFDGGDGFDTLDFGFSLDGWTISLSAGTAAILTGGATVLQESFVSIEAVIGGAGADTLTGDGQNNRLEGGDGVDVLAGGGGNDVFVYRGSDTGVDLVDGGDGTDRIEAMEADTMIGLQSLSGVEEISGNGHAGVVITGTNSADSFDLAGVAVSGISLIYLAAGNDVLVGSSGSDVVDLGLGDDVFRTSGDQPADSVTGGDGTDRVEAGADGTVIRLTALPGVEQISAAGFANVTVGGTAAADVLSFATVTLTGIVRIDGGDGNDTLTGSALADTMRGGLGNDILAGGLGNDIFEIAGDGDGMDTVDGGGGTDQILAVSQGVTIRLAAQSTGVETITGLGSALVYGALNDSINLTGVTLNGIVSIDAGSGNDTLIGSGANDTILAGLGNDTLTGNGGNDSYVFNLGDGSDIVQEFSSGGTGSGGTDALVFGAGINADEVTIAKTGNDVILTVGASGETVTLKSQAGTTSSYWVEEVRFADGTVWDRTTTISTPSYGTAAGESLTGTSGSDLIFGLGGNDTLTGAASVDRLFGGEGADTIVGGLGDDVLSGGGGNDIFSFTNGDGYDFVSGGAGYDMIVATAANCAIALTTLSGIEEISTGGFSGVTVWGSNIAAGDSLDFSGVTMTGIVKIDGGGGNDMLIGSAGADTLVGGAGNDTLSGHLGNDTIDGGANVDTVDYSAESAAWSIDLTVASNNAQSASQTDTLIGIENVNGGSAADTITGSTAANALNGFGGDDRITGGAGNDSLQGGLGNDVAVFAGLQASYSIVTAGGSIQIVDNQPTVDGNDGTDTLAGVEIVEFKGGVQVALAAPVVLDLDGNGVTLESRAVSQAKWDWNNDGVADRTGWIGAGDGILVYDRDGDGRASSSIELSFVDDSAGARSDLEGLRAFDGNGDGLLSSGDAAWADFRVWADRDLDGRVDSGEMLSMDEARVASITLAGAATDQAWGWDDNIVINTGQFTRSDGSTSALADVAFNYAPAAGPAGTAGQSPPAQAASAQPGKPPIDASGDPSGPAPAASGDGQSGGGADAALAAGTGTATSAAAEGAAKPAALKYAERAFGRKAKKYTLASVDGQLAVNLRKAGAADPRAGALPGATIMKFGNESVGMLSPVILDLDGDGIELRSRKDSGARFDMDGDGTRDDTGWHGRGDGFLVIDRNLDGIVNNGSELSFLTEDPAAKSDLGALASLDSNRDGTISSADKRFGELKLWIDQNGNGVTDAGELKSLADHGIASISLAGRSSNAQAKVGSNLLLATSTFTRTDGTVGTVGDAALAFKPSLSGSRAAGPGIEPMSQAMRGMLEALRAGADSGGGLEGGLGRIMRQAQDSGLFPPQGEGEPEAAAGSEAAQAGSGLRPQLPAGIDGPAGVASDSATDNRVAQMVQQMATFGARSGEMDWNRAGQPQERYDYFAA